MPGHIEGEGPRGEPTPQQPKPTEQHKPQQERGNGAPGIRPTLNELSKPPPESPVQGGGESTSGQPKKQPILPLDPISRMIREAFRRDYPDPEERIRFIRRMAVMIGPSPLVDSLLRRAGIEPEQLSPDAETILRIFGSSYDKSANDDKR